MTEPDTWAPLRATCERFTISRRTLYRMLPDLEQAGVAMRVPPRTGPYRIAQRAMESWLRRRNGVGKARQR